MKDPTSAVCTVESTHPGGGELTEKALALAGSLSGLTVVDIGCGSGSTLRMLLGKAGRICGIDLSHLRAVTAQQAGVPAVQSDAGCLPLADASADLLFAECVLSFLPSPAGVLMEWKRVLQPAGRLIFSDLYWRVETGAAELRSLAGEAARKILTRAELASALRAAGMNLETWEDQSEFFHSSAEKLADEGSSPLQFWQKKLAEEPSRPALDGFALAIALSHARPGYFLASAAKGGEFSSSPFEIRLPSAKKERFAAVVEKEDEPGETTRERRNQNHGRQ